MFVYAGTGAVETDGEDICLLLNGGAE